MKNIKPAYAVNFGQVFFGGEKWQCSKCGAFIKPSGGKCPASKTGSHTWRKV